VTGRGAGVGVSVDVGGIGVKVCIALGAALGGIGMEVGVLDGNAGVNNEQDSASIEIGMRSFLYIGEPCLSKGLKKRTQPRWVRYGVTKNYRE
jgi:hypothetical protein